MKKLIIPLLFSQIFNPLAFAGEMKSSQAQTVQYRNVASEQNWLLEARKTVSKHLAEQKAKIDEQIKEKKQEVANKISDAKKKLGEQATEALRNASLSYSFEVPSLNLGIINLNPLQIESSSEMKYPNKWSRVDTWESSLSLPVGMKYVSLSGDIRRKITYVRLFDNQEDSINPDKLLYNPFDKIPLNAEEALANLKEGEIVGYQAPFSISLGTEQLKKYIQQVGTFGINAFDKQSITTDVEFQIQRMQNNHFRVRAYTSRGINNTLTIKAFVGGINGALLRILSLHPLDIFISHDHTGLYATDLVFNLNTEAGKKAFSELISTDFDIQKKINLAQLFIQDKTDLKNIAKAELDSINKVISDEEEAKIPVKEKSIIKIATQTTDSTTDSNRFASNFFQLFKLKFTDSEQKSYVLIDKESTPEKEISSEKEPTSLLVFKKSQNFEYTAAKVWKGGSRDYLGLLIETDNDKNRKPVKFLGIQTFKQRQENIMSPKSYVNLQNRLKISLPQVVAQELKFPNIEHDLNSVRTQQTLFLKTEAMEALKTVAPGVFLQRIKEILAWHSEHRVQPSAEPEFLVAAKRTSALGIESDSDSYVKTIKQALSSADYVQAFEVDTNRLANYFSQMFSPKASAEERLNIYTEKLRNNKFFKALGIRALLRSLPQDKVKDAIAFEFILTARDHETIKTTYPAGIDMNISNTYNKFMNETDALNVRNYELNTYFNVENGSIKTVEQLLKGK